jgi:hypothetical protein
LIVAKNEQETLADLDSAWDDFLGELKAARAEMQDSKNFVPPRTDRNNAEGYRYMLGHIYRMIESEVQQDSDFPYFQQHPNIISKYTIENADCLYLYAPINPDALYRVTGKAADFTHWRSARSSSAESYAPNYVIFEAHTVSPGDSGGIEENTDGSKATIGRLDTREIQVNPDGTFEILVGAERPDGYIGNFIPTIVKKGSTVARGDVLKEDKRAYKLIVRELFGDWEKEEPLKLYIERVGAAGQYPKVRTVEGMAAQLRHLGTLVKNHMRYWTQLYARPLHPSLLTLGQKVGSLVPLPVNALFTPRANTTEAGGGQSTNAMTGGLFELTDDQALVIEIDLAAQPDQLGFHLSNYWGESYDYANHVTSLNHLQTYQSSDGVYRYVVSARDPGVQNWMDTVGYDTGYMLFRFTYSTMPSPDQLPKVKTHVAPFAEVRKLLPSDTPVFTAEDRMKQIRARQLHVARRYRQY